MKMLAMMALCGCVLLVDGPAVGEDDPPVDCNNAQSQSDMNLCAYQDLEVADAALNAQYKMTRAVMVTWDSDLEADQKGAETALVKAQRAWIDYRDNHCVAYAFQSHQGSMEPMLDAGCRTALTQVRTKELKDLAAGMGN